MEIIIENLVTVKTFADLIGITQGWLRKLEDMGDIEFVVVDGVMFVDKVRYKSFLTERKKTAVIKRIKRILKTTKK